MARRVDPALAERRRRAIASILLALNNINDMVDKCAELESRTRAEVGGHRIGEVIIDKTVRAQGSLQGARTALSQAQQACHGIDVTVEVPDEEPE